MHLIETSHLKTWAGSKPAESRFPHLIKELIQAVIRPDKLRMPSGDAVWVPGFDGVVVSSEKSRFVPTGESVWEVGTRADIKGQATTNYQNRSKDTPKAESEGGTAPKLDRSQATFVFVTPRVWKGKDKWECERKAEAIWKDVVVIDGVDLQDWLETAPVVNLRFAAQLHIVPEVGLQTPEGAWEEWSRLIDPQASEELVIVGREEQEKALLSRLIAPPSTFTVRGDSPREAWGFVLATLRRVDSADLRQCLNARSIVAEDEEVAGRLRHLQNLVIVLKQARGQVSGVLSSAGCHVVIPEGNDAHSERDVIVLKRPTHRPFAEALERMGLQAGEVERVARACGLSVTILQRQRAYANFERPNWSGGPSVAHLKAPLLAGRWNDRNETDRQILCLLGDTPDYACIVSRLQEFLFVDEPPLQKVGDIWTVTAPVDAFQLMARRLISADLDRFSTAFREVFGRIDPKVDLPPDEWLYQGLKAAQGHSDWLRGGMAETLLLIAERGLDAELVCLGSPRSYAEEVVRGLPGLNDDWRTLASIRDQYPLLMEAAPGPLLDGLERLLGARPDDVRRVFTEGGLLGGGSMHTGLLWGLETLAWCPEYLPRVALILARLASLDPGVRMHNRPINSLAEIFLWWYPGTNAPLEQRVGVIDQVLAREPVVGWDLLAMLLPKGHPGVFVSTARPRWRDFGDLPEDARTRTGQAKYVAAIADRALRYVGSDPERWRAILDSLRAFDTTYRDRAIGLLESIAPAPMNGHAKHSLWELLRDFTSHHRAFEDAGWALPSDVVARLETIIPFLAPDDPVERNRWLFDKWLPGIPLAAMDTEEHEREVGELRRQAIADILEGPGLEGLVKLGTTCKFPGFVASTAVSLIAGIGAVHDLMESAILAGEAGVLLASDVSGCAQEVYGEEWCGLIRREAEVCTWPPEVAASLLTRWPDEKSTWHAAMALGEEVAAAYWRRKRIRRIEGSPADQIYQIDRLIGAGRACEVLDLFAFRGEGVPTDALVRVFDAALAELARARTGKEIRAIGLSSHEVQAFLGQLRMRADLPREELARREYQALPLLASVDAPGLTIHDLMAEDPGFFVDVLCDVFLPARVDKGELAEPTREQQARAEAGYRLLAGMNTVPGQGEEQVIDEGVLMQWVEAVRKKAAEVDREAVANERIGEILAHASIDLQDGAWPDQAVRNVIEELATDDVDRGLMIGRRNMRGVYMKDLYEGGAQERSLAGQYRAWAEISRVRWPRMARVLDEIAESWEGDARREDIRAEQEKWR